jgi:hypothetical protein
MIALFLPLHILDAYNVHLVPYVLCGTNPRSSLISHPFIVKWTHVYPRFRYESTPPSYIKRKGNQLNIEIVMDVAHLDKLIQAGSDNGKITNEGIVNSLLAKVKSESLQALANEVNAQSGKKIDKAFADLLLKAIEFSLKTDVAA